MKPEDALPELPDLPLEGTVRYRVRPRPDRRVGSDDLRDLRVEVVGGPMDGMTARVPANELTIGRGRNNHLALVHDPQVSSRHARIVREGSTFWLEDLESANGTYVGDERIEKRSIIFPESLFVLGSTCLELMPG